MGMKKIDMITQMLELTKIMTPVMKWANLDKKLLIPVEAIDLHVDFIREGYKWLIKLFDMEYKEIHKIWGLQSVRRWERYKTWGLFDEHEEVKLLKKTILPFRKILVSRNRPNFFKKGKINEEIKKLSKQTNS